ncbi:MAG: hypothetical protein ISS12_00255 [Candidatus Marinimicrobia bacterium]|nr:hypothetical protein [Candidatus Neomarinimicrobiota bacterium]
MILSLMATSLWAQRREYKVMRRGMMRESLYNNGIISTPFHNDGMDIVDHPQMEWPKYSSTVEGTIIYDGQHNTMGGGIHISGNIHDKPFQDERHFSFCGLVGGGGPEETIGIWNFPVEFRRIENYPILADGSLNLEYDPEEAEEIIYAKWATSMGVTITRVSRAWSYPDYDDMIIHEYELVFDGNTDSDPTTIEEVVIERGSGGITTLDTVQVWEDFVVFFGQSWGPNMFAYQRQPEYGGIWNWKPGLISDGNHQSFDHKLWTLFNFDTQTNGSLNRKAKPEPNLDLFEEWARTGKNGGGLLAPQAVGMSMLYYDTKHLSAINIATDTSVYDGETSYAWKANDHELFQFPDEPDSNVFRIKQPWEIYKNKGWFGLNKLYEGASSETEKRGNPFGTSYLDDPRVGETWVGRGAFSSQKANAMPLQAFAFGPYTIHRGDTVEFSMAQVVGYGTDSREIMGGGSHDQSVLFMKPVHIDSFDVILKNDEGNDVLMTSHYISDYGYPDYVNSDVITIQDVSRKAYEMYTGDSLARVESWGTDEFRYWPENNARDGKYVVQDIPWPAPVIDVANTALQGVRVAWNREVEDFPYTVNDLGGFNLYRAYNPLGPWKLLVSKIVGDVNSDNSYEFFDEDTTLKMGEAVFYAATSFDTEGFESGKSNIFPDPDNADAPAFRRSQGAVEELGDIVVTPNPFFEKSGFSGTGEDNMIGFYGLPAVCTIRIYSYSGQLVETLEHDSDAYSHQYFQVSRNDQIIAAGLYFFSVSTPDGQTTGGKFFIIK